MAKLKYLTVCLLLFAAMRADAETITIKAGDNATANRVDGVLTVSGSGNLYSGEERYNPVRNKTRLIIIEESNPTHIDAPAAEVIGIYTLSCAHIRQRKNK
jgi:hypothetical protein